MDPPPVWNQSGMPSGLWVGEDTMGGKAAGYFRFALTSDIPSGAVIENVWFQVNACTTYNWDETTAALRVWLEDSEDAQEVSGFDAFPFNSGGRSLGNQSVRWPEAGGLVWDGEPVAPDLAPLVQELIDAHDGLEAGAHVQVWVAADVLQGQGERAVCVLDYWWDDDLPARLQIHYRAPQ